MSSILDLGIQKKRSGADARGVDASAKSDVVQLEQQRHAPDGPLGNKQKNAHDESTQFFDRNSDRDRFTVRQSRHRAMTSCVHWRYAGAAR